MKNVRRGSAELSVLIALLVLGVFFAVSVYTVMSHKYENIVNPVTPNSDVQCMIRTPNNQCISAGYDTEGMLTVLRIGLDKYFDYKYQYPIKKNKNSNYFVDIVTPNSFTYTILNKSGFLDAESSSYKETAEKINKWAKGRAVPVLYITDGKNFICLSQKTKYLYYITNKSLGEVKYVSRVDQLPPIFQKSVYKILEQHGYKVSP